MEPSRSGGRERGSGERQIHDPGVDLFSRAEPGHSWRALKVQAVAEGAAVVTSNVRHFENVVRAMEWKDVPET
jgi:hypothetical protein